MKPRFDLFVILAGMRTGSNLLEASLNDVPGLACHGEAFNPHFPGWPKRDELLGIGLAAREADPVALIDRMRAAPGLNGFRYFHDHDPRILDPLLADRRCAKIVLTRNPLESHVSLAIARETGQWKLGPARPRRTAAVRFDAEVFAAELAARRAFHARIAHGLQVTGQAAFHLDYEDLSDAEVLSGLARFLGVEAAVAPSRALVRQNPEPVEARVDNPAEMRAALAGLDPFGLEALPNFEPRRGPAIPKALAVAGPVPGSGLVFLPVPGGPVSQVDRWLGAIGPVETGFTQKSLRRWLADHPRHRIFTVLRHPLPRAFAAFADHVLAGQPADLALALSDRYGIAPPSGAGAGDPPALRASFLAFLVFLKANLNGQTGLRTDATWASQQALLQGFGQFAPPDRLLREDDLARGLADLAAETGIVAPPPPPGPPGRDALAAIADEAIEAAAAEAYARDLALFGFGRWRR